MCGHDWKDWAAEMRCYYVLVHGVLDWHVAGPDQDGHPRPRGFYCHRYVPASDAERAIRAAFGRVRRNFERRFDWLTDQHASLRLEVEEMAVVPLYNLLRRRNPGHAFYTQD